VTEPEITVPGNPGVEPVCEQWDAGEIKKPSQRPAQWEVTEDFSGSLHSFPAFPSFVQEIHCLKVIHPGQEWKKYPGLVFLEMEIENRMTPIPTG